MEKGLTEGAKTGFGVGVIAVGICALIPGCITAASKIIPGSTVLADIGITVGTTTAAGALIGAVAKADEQWTTGCEAAPSCGKGTETSREACTFYGTSVAYCCDSVARLEVTPGAISVQAGQSQSFSVTAYDFDNNTVNSSNYAADWSVGNATFGSVNSQGVFTASQTLGVTTVTASRRGISASADVTVISANLTRIDVTPSTATVTSGTSQVFTATGYDPYNNIITLGGVNWNSSNASVGQMAGSTFFAVTAGSTVVSASVGNVSGTASVTVVAGPLARIGVTPNPVSLNASATQQFVAAGYDLNNNSIAIAPTWAITAVGEPCGSINSTGFFTAAYAFNGSSACQVTAVYQSINGVASVAVLDNIPPSVSYLAPTPNGGKQVQSWFLVNVTFNEPVANAVLSVNGSTTAMTMQPGNLSAAALSGILNDGYYEFSVYAQDAAGNIAAGALRNVTIDSLNKPIITLISPANGSAILTGTVIDLNVSGDPLDRAWYSVNGGADIALPSPYNISTAGWGDGNYTIIVQANSTAGSAAAATYLFTVLGTGVAGYALYANGTPVSNAVVAIDGTATNVTANAGGYYSLLGLAAGSYNLTASKQGYTTDSRTGVSVSNGSVTQVNFTLSKLAFIQGYAGDDTGAAVGNSLISFISAGYSGSANTDASGYYGAYVPLGTYVLAAGINSGYVNQTLSGVTLQEGGAADVDFTLTRTGSISGVVYDDTGASPAPLSGATITFVPTAGSWYVTNATIADGTFRIAGIAPGVYNVTATMPGLATSTISGIIVNKAANTIVPAFYLS
jgi:hypothetical protein